MKKQTISRIWLSAIVLWMCGAINSLAQTPSGEEGKWTFVAHLTNPGDTLLIVRTDNLKEINTVVRTGSEFRFTTQLKEPKNFLMLSPSLLNGEAGGFSFAITAVPGEALRVEGLCDNSKPDNGLRYNGSPFYSHYVEADIAATKVKDGKDAQPAVDFIKAYPDCESAATLIGAVGSYCPDRLDEVLALLSPTIRNGRMKAYIDREIGEAKAYVAQQEMEGKMLPMGSVAPDFTLDDINGQPLTLSSLRGKYVVLDFWGSWCGWCIKGFPDMKEYYNKYKDKIEILGMDCNDTVEKWKKAVSDNALPWLHVYVPKGSTVLKDYMVSGFPTKVIISPDGKVLTTILGEDPQFYQLLDEIFKAD